jgi:Flp pilus assembly pilin Flp
LKEIATTVWSALCTSGRWMVQRGPSMAQSMVEYAIIAAIIAIIAVSAVKALGDRVGNALTAVGDQVDASTKDAAEKP